MKSIPAFSKEMYTGDTVSNDDGQRSGFTEHYKITKCPVPEMPRHLVKGMTWEGGENYSHNGGEENHPAFKARSDDGMPSFPAPFSKTKLSGGPAHPGTPA